VKEKVMGSAKERMELSSPRNLEGTQIKTVKNRIGGPKMLL
jgi:hypothetical protein